MWDWVGIELLLLPAAVVDWFVLGLENVNVTINHPTQPNTNQWMKPSAAEVSRWILQSPSGRSSAQRLDSLVPTHHVITVASPSVFSEAFLVLGEFDRREKEAAFRFD